MSFALMLFQPVATAVQGAAVPILSLSDAFMLLFITVGPPLKTPAAYYARAQFFDSKTRHNLAWKTFALATVAVLIGGFLGAGLRSNWHISIPAMLLAGGVIFFLVSLQTVLGQYTSEAPVAPPPAAPGHTPAVPRVPGAFETAVPMIVTPYGLAALIILLASSHSTERTVAIVLLLVGVMVLHLLAMLFAGPIVRSIGPLPFKLFGTIIGSLTVGLSIQMMMAALIQLGLLPASIGLLGQ